MGEELEKLEAAFNRLQTIEITSSIATMEKLLQSLYDIRDVYNAVKEKEDERASAETE